MRTIGLNDTILGVVKNNISAVAAGASGVLVGGALGYAAGKSTAGAKKKRKTSSKRRKTTYRRRVSRSQRKPYTAGKGKDRSHRRIRFTKNNQPYIILASGKARFIKKSSVRRSRKRKGGRY